MNNWTRRNRKRVKKKIQVWRYKGGNCGIYRINSSFISSDLFRHQKTSLFSLSLRHAFISFNNITVNTCKQSPSLHRSSAFVICKPLKFFGEVKFRKAGAFWKKKSRKRDTFNFYKDIDPESFAASTSPKDRNSHKILLQLKTSTEKIFLCLVNNKGLACLSNLQITLYINYSYTKGCELFVFSGRNQTDILKIFFNHKYDWLITIRQRGVNAINFFFLFFFLSHFCFFKFQ